MAGRNLFAPTSSAPSVSPAPQETGILDELGRQAARTLRSGATGIASALDTPRIITDPLYTAGYYGSKALGAEGAQDWFKQELARPTYGQMAKDKIDELTGGELKPHDKIEQISDIGSEFLASAMTPDVVTKGAKTISAMTDKAKLPSVDDIKAASQQMYDEVLNSGVVFGDDFSKGMAESTKKFLPKTKVQKTVLSGSPATQYASRFQKFSGKPMTIEDIDLIDKDLTDEIYSLSISKPNEARKLSDIQDAFRESIGKQPVAKDLAKARDLWAQQAKMRDITKIMDNAALTDNPAKSIQTAFRGLLRNEKRMKGFTQQERKLIGKAAKTGSVIDLMRVAGSRLNTIAMAAATGNIPLAAATFVGGTGARGIAETMQRAKGDNVLRAISERPIGEVIPAIEKVATPNLAQSVLTGTAASMVQPEPAIQESVPQTEAPVMPKGRNLFAPQPDVQLPATIPDTQPQASLLNRIMMAESGGRKMAMNDKSTAAGLYQFTDGTWSSMVKKYGDTYGITKADKMNPQAQEKMAGLLLQENGNLLTRSLGRQLDDGDYYVAHVLGAGDAAKVLKAYDKGASISASQLVAKGVPAANKGIFYDGTRPRSVKEVVAILKKKVQPSYEVAQNIDDLTPQQRGLLKARGLL